MNTSRFLQLFNRGRYVSTRSIERRESESKSPETRHEERERFAVAAIAFYLNYDRQFKKHFLKIVAQLTPAKIKNIEVEPEHWGDLVLEGKQDVIVVEFKLGALLVEHQHPTTRLFSSEGYGAKIKERYGANGKALRYVVVGKDFEDGRTSDGLAYFSVPWRRFLRAQGEESSIEIDLYDCLGMLGAPVFSHRTMKQKSLSGEAEGAMAVYKLLKSAADANTISMGETVSDVDHVGINLAKKGAAKGSQHATLVEMVKPSGRTLGWIGYEQLEEGLCLSVWFYCSAKQTKVVEIGLEKLKLGKTTSDGSAVGVFRRADSQKDHGEWFNKVLSLA